MNKLARETEAVEALVDDTDHLDVTGDELELLFHDKTFRRLAVAAAEIDEVLDDGDFSPESYARTFSSTARGKLRLAAEERARVVLGRPVPLPPEEDGDRVDELSEPFEGVAVAEDPLVVDDGSGFEPVPEELADRLDDVSIGDGVRVEEDGIELLDYNPIGVVTGSEAVGAVTEGDVVYVWDHDSEDPVAAGFDDVDDARAWIEASDREEIDRTSDSKDRSELEPVDAREL